MALNFPSSPAVNDIYTSGGKSWKWNGTSWISNIDVFTSIVNTITGSSVDCRLGNYFSKSVSANTTFTFDNPPTSLAYSFTLEIDYTSGTITWPTSVYWPGGTAPSLTSNKTHLFTFVTDDAGSRWLGSLVPNYSI